MKSALRGKDTSRVEVTNITPFGVRMSALGAEKFLPLAECPWFKSASVGQIGAVELPSDGHPFWPKLDIDLAAESIDSPWRLPLKYGLERRNSLIG